MEEAWGDHDLQAGRAAEAVLHFQTAKAVSRAAAAAVQAGDVGLAGSLLDQMVRARRMSDLMLYTVSHAGLRPLILSSEHKF